MKQKPKTGTIAPGYCKEAGRMVLMSYEGEAGRLCLHNENETDDRKEVLAWIKEHNQNKKMKGGDMKYVLVEFPEDSSYFEDNGIGYPCCESEDNGARYVPEEDYVKVFGRKPDDSMLRRIVQVAGISGVDGR